MRLTFTLFLPAIFRISLFSVHDFYSSHVHQIANHVASRQSPPESANHASSPISNPSHPMHSSAQSSYYHHYHHTVASANQNAATNAGYSPPQNVNQNGSLNGNESPNSVDQFTNNNIQLPETPNSLVTTIMGPTSGNSNSNDATNVAVNETSSAENPVILSNNNNYSPWCSSTGHHQHPLSSTSPLHSTSYNTAHHPSASLYSAHNLSSTLIPHQNISGFAHPSKSYGISQPFYSWY